MSRASDPKWLQKLDKDSPGAMLARAFGENVSHLASYLYGSNAHCLVSLSMRRRGPKDFMVVLTRMNEGEFRREVVFGTGTTATEALANLSRTIARGAWKADKFAGK